MRKFLLLSLFAGIMVVTWQLSRPLMAAEQAQVLNREWSISAIKDVLIKAGNPPNEVEQRVVAGNKIWDAGEAKGLDPKITNALMADSLTRQTPTIDLLTSKAVDVINTTDFSNTPIAPAYKGLIMSNLATAQLNGIAPERVQEISKTLVEVASDPRIDQGSKGNEDSVLNAVSSGMMQGLTSENAKQKGEDVMAIAQQLSAKGYNDEQISQGLSTAVDSLGQGKSREESIQVSVTGLNALNGGATEAAVASATSSIGDAVQAGGDVQKVASAAIGTAQDAITQHQSLVAGEVAAKTTGTAVLNGVAVDPARNMGMQGAEKAAQLEQQFGSLGASSAGPTITAGIINNVSDTNLNNSAQLAATKAVELADKGNGLAAIQTGADITGQTMLTTQNAALSNTAGDVSAEAMTNVLNQNGGFAVGQAAAETAVNGVTQSGSNIEQQATTTTETDQNVEPQLAPAEVQTTPPNPTPLNEVPIVTDQSLGT